MNAPKSMALMTLTSKLAARFDMGDSPELLDTLKATAFKGQVSDAQMTALLIVANQYGLNPWTKEIYAFPDKNNGIVPVVGVDGWSRIINDHPQFDGIDFEQTDTECTCIIYRKDRSHPIRITEYKSECSRNTGPWQSHPKRMLRHKALIQCARIAFGYTGIYDQDEAERIVEGTEAIVGQASGTVIDGRTGEVITNQKPPYPDDKFKAKLAGWQEQVSSGARSADDIFASVSTRYTFTDAQKDQIRAGTPTGELLASAEQIAHIRANAEDGGITEADIFKRFGIQSLDNIGAAMVDPILAFISDPVGA